jgi:hypothetical protein
MWKTRDWENEYISHPVLDSTDRNVSGNKDLRPP